MEPRPTAAPQVNITILDEVGRLQHPHPPTEIAGWKQELKTAHPGPERAAWLHLWLGEWELAQNQQPLKACWHFRQAQALTNRQDRCYGLAAYDQAMAFFYAGAYEEAASTFAALIHPKTRLPGYDWRNCALWLRHAQACDNYHAEHAALGIPEPPRLDPLCGAASLAACLRSLSVRYDRQTVTKACVVTGEGSSLSDILNAGRKLGLNTRAVTADDQGLIALPKPLIAYVEQDHFVALERADKAGVSYLCSDCGAWPGGRVDLTWAQWHALDGGIYATVTKPGSEADTLLREALAPRKSVSPRAVQLSYTGSLAALHLDFHAQASLSALRGHVSAYNNPQSNGCGSKPEALHCPRFQPCAMVCPVHQSPHAAISGDPVNAGTGEEEYTPDPDLVVYNPIGPSVSWSRLYNSLRAPQTSPNQNPVDYGVGWSYSYNYRLYAPNGFNQHGTYLQPLTLYFPNGYSYSFSYIGSNNPPNPAGTALTRTPYAVSYASGVQIIMKDHSRLSFGYSKNLYFYISAITDRWGHSIHFQYSQSGSLTSITDDNNKVLLTVGYLSVSDCYGREVWYQTGSFASKQVPAQYTQSFTELTGVSQVVAASTNPPAPLPMRYTYGYDEVPIGDAGTGPPGEEVAFLHTITVPSPKVPGSTSTATLWYLNEQSDGAKTNPNYSDPNTNSNSGPFVSAIVDSNGNTTTITPSTAAFGNINQTTVQYIDNKGVVLGTSLYGFDLSMNLTSTTDYSQKTTETFKYNSYPYKPSSVTDGNGNTWSYTWDASGNLLTETPPSSTASPPTSSTSSTRTPAATSYGYDFTASPLGDVNSIQTGTKKATKIAYTYSQNVYNGNYYIPTSDYIQSITTPQPGKQGVNSPVVTTNFAFDAYGNLTSLNTPGNAATTVNGVDQGITTSFSYTSDLADPPHNIAAFSQAEAIDEPIAVTDHLGNVTHFRYDNQGQTTAVIDALGHETDTSYVESGSTTSYSGPICQDSKSASFKVDYVSLLFFVLVGCF